MRVLSVMNLNFFVIVLVMSMLVFSSCGKNNECDEEEHAVRIASSKSLKSFISEKNNILMSDILDQAKLIDTPVPVGYEFVEKSSEQDSHSIVCKGVLSVKKTREFYIQEMERLGWDIIDLSNKHEGLLICSKQSRYCAVSMRDIRNDKGKKRKRYFNTKLHLFIKNDKKLKEKTLRHSDDRKILFI